MTEPADKVDILIVDDLPEKLLVFKTVLEELGQNLVFVRSGTEALREVLTREFAVILLDVNMPDIDGFETATLIRALQAQRAHADHLHHRLRRRDADRARLLARRGRLHPVAGRARGAALQGAGVRRAARAAAAHRAPGRRARGACGGRGRAAVAEESTRRSTFLSELSHALSGLLDVRTGMHRLLTMVVPRLAHGATVALLDDRARVRARGELARRRRCGHRRQRRRPAGDRSAAHPAGARSPAGAGAPASASCCATASGCSACCCSPASPARSAWPCSTKWPRARPSRSPRRSSTRACRTRSRSAGAPRRGSKKPASARTSSWRCCRTSCATRWRRSATRSRSSAASAAMTPS